MRVLVALPLRYLMAGVPAIVLAGCAAPGTIVEERAVAVHVPVAQPCVSGPRPDPVTPLKDETPPAEWAALDVKQKAARVGAKGLERQAWGEQLDAATGACPEVTP